MDNQYFMPQLMGEVCMKLQKESVYMTLMP